MSFTQRISAGWARLLILALAIVEPERCCRAFAGDVTAQRELADRHLAVKAGGPAVLKEILAASHGTSAAVRVS